MVKIKAFPLGSGAGQGYCFYHSYSKQSQSEQLGKGRNTNWNAKSKNHCNSQTTWSYILRFMGGTFLAHLDKSSQFSRKIYNKQFMVVKNLPADAGDMRCGFSLWVGKISWSRKWQPTPEFSPRKYPCTGQSGEPKSMESQGLGHDWVTEHTHTHDPKWRKSSDSTRRVRTDKLI